MAAQRRFKPNIDFPQQMVCRLQGSGGDAALAVAGTINRLHFYKTSAVKLSIGSTTGCTITEKAPTRAFSWLNAPTSAFTFKTLLRHYAKWALTPRSLNMKLVNIVSYSCPYLMIIASRTQFHIERLWGQCPFSIVS